MFREESDVVDEFVLNCKFGRDDDIRIAYELLEQYPRNAELWRMCGQLIEMSKSDTYQIDEARYCYEKTVDLKPEHYQGYEDLGDWHGVRNDDYVTAIRYYRQAIELGDRDSSRLELAHALVRVGQKDDAIVELELCADKNEEDYLRMRREILEGLLDPPTDIAV